MIKRPPISQNIQRQLWAESFGFCMNPECNTLLITDTASVADIAHIQEHAKGGSIEFENLILLCKNCHKIIDSSRQNDTQIENKLLQWKEDRQKKLKEIFCKKYDSFALLKENIIPYLKENKNIFDLYGPESLKASLETHKSWVQFEPKIISNNEIILTILKANINLINNKLRDIIDLYERHQQDFINTREPEIFTRQALFPKEILTIFGLEIITEESNTNNLTYLQNLLKKLDKEQRLIDFSLFLPQHLIYTDESNKEERVTLDNVIRFQQILYTEKIYYQKNIETQLRISDVVFILKILFQNKYYNWAFPEQYNFTKILVNDSIELLLMYEYEITVNDVMTLQAEENLIIINTHNWNGGPFSSEALEYLNGLNLNIRALNTNQFAKLCARKTLSN